jgi:hypothetical protein
VLPFRPEQESLAGCPAFSIPDETMGVPLFAVFAKGGFVNSAVGNWQIAIGESHNRSSTLQFAVGTVASKGMDRRGTFLSNPVVKKK